MSTNYYWKMSLEPASWTNPLGETKTIAPDPDDPIIHVCQWAAERYSWAQEPDEVLAYCASHPDDVVIVAEHGVEYTGAQFIKHVTGHRWERDHIGQWFC